MLNYTVKKGLTGKYTLHYQCPCGAKLVSKLSEAGSNDTCPDCDQSFVVPGEGEKTARAAEENKYKEKRTAESHARAVAMEAAEAKKVREEKDRNEIIRNQSQLIHRLPDNKTDALLTKISSQLETIASELANQLSFRSCES